MTLREFTALVRLFQACGDVDLRQRTLTLVPELSEWLPPGPVIDIVHEDYAENVMSTGTATIVLDAGHPRRHHLDRRADDLAHKGAEAGAPNDLLSTSEVAEWMGVSTQWLEIGRSRGYGPKYCRSSARRIRYLRSSVLAFLAEREHARTTEYDAGTGGRKPGSRVVGGRVVPPTDAADATVRKSNSEIIWPRKRDRA